LIRSKLSFLLVATFALVAIAKAEALKVGEAEIIRNEVVSVNGSELLPIVVGDAVVRDEVVSTSADSDARIGLIDSTKLALGPNSKLTWTFASVCSNNSQLCAPLPSLTKKASLPASGAKAVKGLNLPLDCPNGQNRVGDRCVPVPTRDASLPALNDLARDTQTPAIAPTVQLPDPAARIGLPPTAPTLGGGISLPRLGR